MKKTKKNTAIKKTKKASAKKPLTKKTRRILAADETPPFQLLNLKGATPGLIICDHSSNRVPRGLKGLGLKKTDLKRHIGWDIGTEDIGRYMSKMLDMPAILASYTRLVVDLNRAPDHPECMIGVSDHISVPANAALSKKDKEQRLREIYWPYQNQIKKQVDRQVKKKKRPLLISIHSFTPALDEKPRPWHISILWNRQEKAAKRLIAEIRRHYPRLLVGGNEPYSLKGERFAGSTIHRHGEERGLPYVFVEFRQDLVDTKEKAIQWAEMFLRALKPVMESPELFLDDKARARKK